MGPIENIFTNYQAIDLGSASGIPAYRRTNMKGYSLFYFILNSFLFLLNIS